MTPNPYPDPEYQTAARLAWLVANGGEDVSLHHAGKSGARCPECDRNAILQCGLHGHVVPYLVHPDDWTGYGEWLRTQYPDSRCLWAGFLGLPEDDGSEVGP